MTPAELAQAMNIPMIRAQSWAPVLTDAIDRFGVQNVPMFIAQVGHESASFVYLRELWGPTPAQRKYEGRADLGNTHPGDGFWFCGRGLVQITGRNNYRECGAALSLDLLDHPELLERPMHAAASAAWFWSSRKIDLIASPDTDSAFLAVTRKINGGTNGLADRCERWARAKRYLVAQ